MPWRSLKTTNFACIGMYHFSVYVYFKLLIPHPYKTTTRANRRIPMAVNIRNFLYEYGLLYNVTRYISNRVHLWYLYPRDERRQFSIKNFIVYCFMQIEISFLYVCKVKICLFIIDTFMRRSQSSSVLWRNEQFPKFHYRFFLSLVVVPLINMQSVSFTILKGNFYMFYWFCCR